ncbi:MAG: hypothetical protein HC873_00740 [Leptolyngbyaceae cyanobacterium SL_1_1]|nr:hypothetical protein [Leptolyngbyaceae cyanobacterium SL_1_1]
MGYTVVIDDAGQILVHPDSSQQGKNIRQLQDANRLNSIVSNVRAGNSEALHLFNFDTSSDEWIAGYSGLEITVAQRSPPLDCACRDAIRSFFTGAQRYSPDPFSANCGPADCQCSAGALYGATAFSTH